MARAVWTGSLSFGLVNIGVKALTAVREHQLRFHRIQRGTGARIGNQMISKETGEPVDNEDVELGYEVSKGRYVVFEPNEISEMRPTSTRVVEVSDFVSLDAIDPVYFDRTYWLAPTDEGASRAYALLAAAMEKAGKVGIGSVVMRNKQHLAAIRPVDGALAMSTMRFADEVVDVSEFDEIPAGEAEPPDKEMALATQIIDALATEWDPERYHDTFTDELKSIIKAKDEGNSVVEQDAPAGADGAKIIDLMAALQASVEAAKHERTTDAAASDEDAANDADADEPAAGDADDDKAPAAEAAKKSAAEKRSSTAAKRRERKSA